MEIDTTKALSYFLYLTGIVLILIRFIFHSISELGKIITLIIGFFFLVAGSWIHPREKEEIILDSEINTTSKKGKLLAPNEMSQ